MVITLIEIPYWWDGTTESPAMTIHTTQPGLISEPPPTNVKPIPTSSPSCAAKQTSKYDTYLSFPWI